MRSLRLLIAEDSDDDFLLMQQALQRHGLIFEATRITNADQLRRALESSDWDIILCDFSMEGFDALEALEIIRDTGLDIPVIIVSGTIGEEVAVETLKQGANDYILKQNLTRLGPAVEHELRDAGDRRQRRLVEAFSTGQGEVLELILENRPLPEILGHIARRIESLPLSTNRPLCSILLVDPNGTHLVLGAAPNLPGEFSRRIKEKPIPLQEGMGASSLAALQGKTVITEDITTDPEWENIREIALDLGLHSCWSVPVFSSDREILGTVAVYHLTPRHPQEGELKWVTAAVKLVTLAVERSRTAQALREYQDRIRATFAAAGAGIAITWADGRYIMANPSYCTMLGYSETELCKMDFPAVTHPEDRSNNLHWITKLLAGEVDHFTIEKRCLHKKGSIVWVRASVSLMRTTDGRPPNIIAVTEDITQRKQTEEKLRHSEALLKIAGQAALLGGWEVDLTENRVYWSDEVCAIHDMPPEPNRLSKTESPTMPPSAAIAFGRFSPPASIRAPRMMKSCRSSLPAVAGSGFAPSAGPFPMNRASSPECAARSRISRRKRKVPRKPAASPGVCPPRWKALPTPCSPWITTGVSPTSTRRRNVFCKGAGKACSVVLSGKRFRKREEQPSKLNTDARWKAITPSDSTSSTLP